ncbi:hypothetical protein AUEXF2481DRAFT_67794 [Aureobasidium subglaciale EXF-2481]|uniref:Ribose-phosphate pyrophosphokinase 1 n=1 Tax=Aureobasidium subglaciale (strain EXF-2481) TaxID=1043005 RepID=A0A074Y609_AURSE|nr:uncharacterized protein AUEXF2481DRAFT_67794 [Aureobasidium subglaciale EXF-2481]KEQ93125.1 hypothetical protein AUEXF2481DRAFT_67794 [Aureobasidium subglaciale EXF-2481]
MRRTCIFGGLSHPELTDFICEKLGRKPDKVELRKFANGETSVEIKTSVRDQAVFIVQSGSHKTNDDVMELLIMIAACKGGSAKSVTAVMPYFPYSRQSKKKSHRGAITARMIANLMHVAGVNHVVTIDLHASQMQGFFKCPVDNLVAEPLLARWIRSTVENWKEGVVVSKNPGGTKRVTSLADALKLSFGIVTTDTRRPNMGQSMYNSLETTITLVGNVRDRPVFIVDDIIDKAGSWIAAAETVVKRGGATKVVCMATHGLFGGDCLREMDECEEIDAIVVTNAFPIPKEKREGIRKLVILDVSTLLAEAIRRNHHGESISQLYMHHD